MSISPTTIGANQPMTQRRQAVPDVCCLLPQARHGLGEELVNLNIPQPKQSEEEVESDHVQPRTPGGLIHSTK
ncbi:hypothetical protein PGT21_013484 [Puccinia graminis f. sp. tritici]|uniref:Uncharacterized protein n=1 Tax=Puccinia graminis f. sp. tritici TaxID=56615 RepID=A0A5B0M4C5_PUCGR|nr:hypothetical protein PGT21_013484 [Puccinia graminis f. sp. tritici]